MEAHDSFRHSPPKKTALSSCPVHTRMLDMSVFKEKNGIGEGSGHFCGGGKCASAAGMFDLGQGISLHLHLVGASRQQSSNERDSLVCGGSMRTAVTVFNNFIRKGGYSRKKGWK